jgi:hypothetical protein
MKQTTRKGSGIRVTATLNDGHDVHQNKNDEVEENSKEMFFDGASRLEGVYAH